MRLIDADICPCSSCDKESFCKSRCWKLKAWINGCDYDLYKVIAILKLHSTDTHINPEWILDTVRRGGLE